MNFITHFIDLFIESAPWLILGFVIAGLIKSLIPEDFLSRHLGGKNTATTLKAALIGAPLPLCSCGVVPAAIGLRKSGASKNSTVSFLIATPETGIDSVSVTYALMGPVMAVVRPIAAIVSAVVAGVLVGKTDDEKPADNSPTSKQESCCSSSQETQISSCCEPLSQEPEQSSSCCSSTKTESSCCSSTTQADNTWQKLSLGLRFAFNDLIDDIALWLVIGLVFAAAVLTWVPETFLVQWGNHWLAFVVMALIGVPMYICATASTPIAAGLLFAGVSPGAVLVFMMTGPATNIGSLMIIRQELGQRALNAYLAGVVLVSFVFGYLLNWLYEAMSWPIIDANMLANEESASLFAMLCAIGLAALIINSFYKSLKKRS